MRNDHRHRLVDARSRGRDLLKSHGAKKLVRRKVMNLCDEFDHNLRFKPDRFWKIQKWLIFKILENILWPPSSENHLFSKCSIRCAQPYISINAKKPNEAWPVSCKNKQNPDWVAVSAGRESNGCYFCPKWQPQVKKNRIFWRKKAGYETGISRGVYRRNRKLGNIFRTRNIAPGHWRFARNRNAHENRQGSLFTAHLRRWRIRLCPQVSDPAAGRRFHYCTRCSTYVHESRTDHRHLQERRELNLSILEN